MIRHFFLFLTFCIVTGTSFGAQDTSAYEMQRAKVNALLAERSAKFGQYDESLTARTGIFGMQTKRDIKNSNEILRQITLSDNEIFRELKVLLDFKDLQVEQVKTSNDSNVESIQNYRKTIKTLQDQNQQLADQLNRSDNNKKVMYLIMSIFLIAIIVLAYQLQIKTKRLKKQQGSM